MIYSSFFSRCSLKNLIAKFTAWLRDPKVRSLTFSSIQSLRSFSRYTDVLTLSSLLSEVCFIMLQNDRKLYKVLCFKILYNEAHASQQKGEKE